MLYVILGHYDEVIYENYVKLVTNDRMLAYSRKRELEADRIGYMLYAKCGFDPRKVVDMWGNDGQKVCEARSTHPDNRRRHQQFKALLPSVMKLYKEAEGK